MTSARVELGGAYNISGPATLGQNIYVRQGTINQNGGSLSACSKSMVSTLTTGNFTHNNIHHDSNVSVGLTANNTNRGRTLFSNNLL